MPIPERSLHVEDTPSSFGFDAAVQSLQKAAHLIIQVQFKRLGRPQRFSFASYAFGISIFPIFSAVPSASSSDMTS